LKVPTNRISCIHRNKQRTAGDQEKGKAFTTIGARDYVGCKKYADAISKYASSVFTKIVIAPKGIIFIVNDIPEAFPS
jgi:hypothetical protein